MNYVFFRTGTTTAGVQCELILQGYCYGSEKHPLCGGCAWLADNPCPTLADLIAKHGGYSCIPDKAWADFDREIADWKARLRARHLEESAQPTDEKSRRAS